MQTKTVKLIFIAVLVLAIATVAVEFFTQRSFENSVAASEDSAVYQEVTTGENPQDLETMMVAGGCFWCVEADLEKAPGVQAVLSGYSGGDSVDPTYQTYADGGHREVVLVIYNPDEVSYGGLFYYALKHMDPTDGQGSFVDRGVQYSPAIYFETEEEKEAAEDVLADIASRDVFAEELAVPVLEQKQFWLAEDYHQDFYKKSVFRYQSYRKYSGRDDFIEKFWGQEAADEIPETAQVN